MQTPIVVRFQPTQNRNPSSIQTSLQSLHYFFRTLIFISSLTLHSINSTQDTASSKLSCPFSVNVTHTVFYVMVSCCTLNTPTII